MRLAAYLMLGSTLFIQGCIPSSLTTQVGLSTTIIGSVRKEPLEGVIVYVHLNKAGNPEVLATSDANGKLYLPPRKQLYFLFPGSEGSIPELPLWICKEMYEPQLINGGQWHTNAQHDMYIINVIELKPAPVSSLKNCSAVVDH